MHLRKEQFWQMEELQNKHSEEKTTKVNPTKNYRNVKDCRILSVNYASLPADCRTWPATSRTN
jgi:hypothetical protein